MNTYMAGSESHLQMLVNWVDGIYHTITFSSIITEFSREFGGFIHSPALWITIVFVAFVAAISIPIWLVSKMGEARGYDTWDWGNIAIYVGIWIIAFLCKVFGFFGYEEGGAFVQGYPIITTMFLFLLVCWPVWRTNREVQCLPASMAINIVQALIGVLIAAVILFFTTFNNKNKE
jgi:hypothetical protein